MPPAPGFAILDSLHLTCPPNSIRVGDSQGLTGDRHGMQGDPPVVCIGRLRGVPGALLCAPTIRINNGALESG